MTAFANCKKSVFIYLRKTRAAMKNRMQAKIAYLNQRKQTNKKGFIMTVFLISLPVFISCLMVFTSLFFCIRNHNLAQSLCLKYTLQAQEQINKTLQDLLALNPLAKQLQRTHKQLKHLYLSALKQGNFFAVSALKTKMRIIKQKRIMLDRKQKNILNKTFKYIESAFTEFKQHITKFHPGRIWKEHHRPVPLAVTGKPRRGIAPSYYPMPRFSSHQTFSIHWEMPLYRFLPKWLEKAFFQSDLSLYNCSATIKRSGLTWKATLASLPGFFHKFHFTVFTQLKSFNFFPFLSAEG